LADASISYTAVRLLLLLLLLLKTASSCQTLRRMQS